MGCDIHLFAEGLLRKYPNQEKMWINIDHWYRENGWAEIMLTENEGFNYTDLIDGSRDYGIFYLLAGVRGNEKWKSYPPIANPKGLPEQMDSFIRKFTTEYTEQENSDFHDASYLTLRELKDSGYGSIMRLQGWVYEDEHRKAVKQIGDGQKYQLGFVDVKCQDQVEQGRVLKEWNGYLNLNLTYMIERMEELRKERRIDNDDEIRIVFWFDN